MFALASLLGAMLSGGCAHDRAPSLSQPPHDRPQVVAVAPVLNLSNSSDWDPLKVTDIVASELQSFPGVVVIPVNRTLATLTLMGRDAVATPQDALELARELNADATVVTAVTEYSSYDPPIVGILMQWYATARHTPMSGLDPVSASREAAEITPAAAATDNIAPLVQVQRVYNAADHALLDDVRSFAASRGGHDSPYGWRVYLKSQELFLRYCSWATIRPMLLARKDHQVASATHEVE